MRKTGFLFIIVAAILFFIDRFSHIISDIFGKSICGDNYLQPVKGVVGDMSCGFNMDICLVIGLLLLSATGLLLVVFSRRKQ